MEYAVLKAASEGRWEEIDQVCNRPGQQERVLHAQNKVICTEQHTSIMLSFLNTQLVVFRCSLIVGLFCSMQFGWSPLHFAVYYGHLNIVNPLVHVCRLPPEQKTKVRTGGQGLLACQVQVACPVISACLHNGPSKTSHLTCFVVSRPQSTDSRSDGIRIQSTYGARLSTAQWNSLLRMCIYLLLFIIMYYIYYLCACICGHPRKWIQFAFNPSHVWTGLMSLHLWLLGGNKPCNGPTARGWMASQPRGKWLE